MSSLIYYNSLCDLVCNRTTSPMHLRALKGRFENEIKSIRRKDAIKSIKDLVNVLKKRACIDKDNCVELENIARSLGLPLPPKNNTPVNRNGLIGAPAASQRFNPRPDVIQNPNFVYPSSGDVLSLTTVGVKNRVYKMIASEIGQKWKHFARSLGVHEGHLDELEGAYVTISERVYQILYNFEDNCDGRRWKTQLLDALVEARRKDLKQRANDIFDTHNC